MIIRKEDVGINVRQHLRGGSGEVRQQTVVKNDEVPNLRAHGIQTIEKGATIGYHIHENETEIYFVLKGRAGFDDNGKRVILNEGDAIITRSGEGHAVSNAGDGDLVIFTTIIKN